ncbi:hypothetical protein F2Q70_00030037 [Brassica cretica]|uniref:Uncharacterized protein n=2 Tax=Brassica cretica TaxID=69181 RepID=A0A3N6RCB0_BRACR|nr:hypothetical protein F2Q70_00030037 [Brassica cretica]KAF2552824.1 hypothetical protein F2Q68_00034518 [Brassica cretica]KAF3490221.1 hypothetical protein F2Q69_00053306 [Brassica cretica]KAF3594551.1 hypothetical protein DY000_02022345 [Brassica cretica]
MESIPNIYAMVLYFDMKFDIDGGVPRMWKGGQSNGLTYLACEPAAELTFLCSIGLVVVTKTISLCPSKNSDTERGRPVEIHRFLTRAKELFLGNLDTTEHVYAAPPLVGPASSVVEDKLAEWRSRYSLPPSVILRVPTSEERASSYILREFAIYEALFDSGLRGLIPALIAGLCNLFEISPSQLNPPA